MLSYSYYEKIIRQQKISCLVEKRVDVDDSLLTLINLKAHAVSPCVIQVLFSTIITAIIIVVPRD